MPDVVDISDENLSGSRMPFFDTDADPIIGNLILRNRYEDPFTDAEAERFETRNDANCKKIQWAFDILEKWGKENRPQIEYCVAAFFLSAIKDGLEGHVEILERACRVILTHEPTKTFLLCCRQNLKEDFEHETGATLIAQGPFTHMAGNWRPCCGRCFGVKREGRATFQAALGTGQILALASALNSMDIVRLLDVACKLLLPDDISSPFLPLDFWRNIPAARGNTIPVSYLSAVGYQIGHCGDDTIDILIKCLLHGHLLEGAKNHIDPKFWSEFRLVLCHGCNNGIPDVFSPDFTCSESTHLFFATDRQNKGHDGFFMVVEAVKTAALYWLIKWFVDYICVCLGFNPEYHAFW